MNALDATALDAPIDAPLMGEINMTPLVDVMLVLLIVFMVTLPALVDAAQVRLPQARSTPLPRNLPHVDVRDVQGSDPVSLIAYDKVLVTVSAVKKFEELLG